jgi:beta-galactosidase
MKRLSYRIIPCLFLLGWVVLSAVPASAVDSPHERVSLDLGWKFHLGNSWGDVLSLDKADANRGPAKPGFSDSGWRSINLPHDWAIELPFDPKSDASHGFKPVGPGYPENDFGWYRGSFDLEKTDAGKRIWLDFDGVYQSCDVYVNGWFAGHHDDGYASFRCDVTDVVHVGKPNVIAVLVDASRFEGWFYEGAGIYRHVWLEKTAPVTLAFGGVHVTTSFPNNVPGDEATVNVEANVLNATSQPADAKVSCEIFSPSGASLAKFDASDTAPASGEKAIALSAKLASPLLWSPEAPNLYKLATTVTSGGKLMDYNETPFGARTLAWDANDGFLLNGHHYELKGVCNHQDHAGVGAAVPDALQYFRIKKLKEFGCNSLRTSHNAPTAEVLEACDQLGLLVLDENRVLGSDAANLERLKGQILRDRNHPCVFAWSLGNEEWSAQGTAEGAAVLTRMQDLAHQLDSTRLCTCAVNGSYGDVGIFAASDVGGLNYNIEQMDRYHEKHPAKLILGTEQASTIGTRGIFTNDTTRGYVSSYDDNNPSWGQTAEAWWSFFDARPWLSGGFVWTGFDYRGEPTPYQWPCINSHFGILDTCGFPKGNFWYYQAWWGDKPVLHLLPHWNFPGREGQEIDVRALSNCEEVELFLNGQSLGRQKMRKNSELKWKVKYAPGTLSAKGYNGGNVIAETKMETTGAPSSILLTPDRSAIDADGRDVSVFSVSVVDSQGRVEPLADNNIHFTLAGPGAILGVGNGDPSSHEPDTFLEKRSSRSVPADDGWRFKMLRGVKKSDLPELQPAFNDSSWETTNPHSEDGPLHQHQEGVFRKKLSITAAELASESVVLGFGSLDDEGWVYVNGSLVGESHEWQDSPSFNIKPFLRAGDNDIAVAIVNHEGPGGVCKGVTVEFVAASPAPAWQRSVFNGLAQVIVQSKQTPGEIQLTASADGLSPATVTIQSK